MLLTNCVVTPTVGAPHSGSTYILIIDEYWRCSSLDPAQGHARCINSYSTRTPEVRITSAHFVISAWIRAENCSALDGTDSAPCSISLALKSGVRSTRTVSTLSLSMIARGVPAGANSPNQTPARKLGTVDSAMVGTSGMEGDRSAVP